MNDDKPTDTEPIERDSIDEAPEEEVKELMKNHELDVETAEKAQELIEEGLDEEDAVEIAEEM